ncbi:MAG: hypothetical protein ABWW65_02505 [Thermoprotei archaeon]
MDLHKLGLVLVFTGIILALIAAFLPLLLAPLQQGETRISGAACILLFFIPICFSYGELAPLLMIVSLVLVIVVVVVLIVILKWIMKTISGTFK